MSRKALPNADPETIKLVPPVRRRIIRKFRFLWGHGVFSGLPLVEVLLLIAFIASAGMFFTLSDANAYTKTANPSQKINAQSIF